MNFEFSDEQQQLHDTVDRYLTGQYTFEKFRVINASAAGWDKAAWAGLGELGDASGVSLFRIPRDAKGLILDAYPTIDGQRAAEVYLQGVQVPASGRLGPDGGALPMIEAALDIGLAALCAEAVGVMQALVDATVPYVHSRQPFGVAIGRVQALQHRIPDMLT